MNFSLFLVIFRLFVHYFQRLIDTQGVIHNRSFAAPLGCDHWISVADRLFRKLAEPDPHVVQAQRARAAAIAAMLKLESEPRC